MEINVHHYSLAEITNSNAGFNIAIESEKIFWIVFIFYFHQSPIILTITGSNKVLVFIH